MFQARIRRLAQEWNDLSDENKQVYITQAKELLNVYNHELNEWETKMLKTLDMSEEEIEDLRKVLENIPYSKFTLLISRILQYGEKSFDSELIFTEKSC